MVLQNFPLRFGLAKKDRVALKNLVGNMHSEKNDEVELKKYTDVACNNGFSPILFEIRLFYSLTDFIH